MAKILHSPATCAVCGETLATGSRVRKHVGRYAHLDACAPAATADSATPRQITYAESLQASYYTPAVYARRYTHAEFVAMSKAEISDVIGLLVTERDLQTAY